MASVKHTLKANLAAKLKADVSSLKKVVTVQPDWNKIKNWDCPLVHILDTGQDSFRTKFQGYAQYVWPVQLVAFADSGTDPAKTANDAIDAIRDWIHAVTPADIDSNLLSIVDGDTLGFVEAPTAKFVGIPLQVTLTYKKAYSYTETQGQHVYSGSAGDANFLDAVRDDIYSKLTTLQGLMSGSIDPTFSAVYKSHSSPILQLNAITIDLDPFATFPTVFNQGKEIKYDIPVTLRVHSDFIGGETDTQKILRLVNSITNYLHDKKLINQSTRYRIRAVDGARIQEFEDTNTVGAEFQVLVTNTKQYEAE